VGLVLSRSSAFGGTHAGASRWPRIGMTHQRGGLGVIHSGSCTFDEFFIYSILVVNRGLLRNGMALRIYI